MPVGRKLLPPTLATRRNPGHLTQHYSPNLVEGVFSELRLHRVLGSSFYAGSGMYFHVLQCLNWHGALGIRVAWSVKVN